MRWPHYPAIPLFRAVTTGSGPLPRLKQNRPISWRLAQARPDKRRPATIDSMRRSLLLLAVLPALAQTPSDRIGTIDFYGYGHLDVASLRAALPFREGDTVPSASIRDSAVRALKGVAGRQAVISGVCCSPDGRSSVYVGLPEVGASPVTYNPQPQGDVKLPEEV